jgi:hypothetical protein
LLVKLQKLALAPAAAAAAEVKESTTSLKRQRQYVQTRQTVVTRDLKQQGPLEVVMELGRLVHLSWQGKVQ